MAKSLRQVNKREARKLWNEGKEVGLIACKLYPSMMWGLCRINKADHEGEYGNDFDSIVANFESYNCTYETGYYAAYYV